jgi:hypothetical protein
VWKFAERLCSPQMAHLMRILLDRFPRFDQVEVLWKLSEFVCHPSMTQLSRTLVENDFGDLTIFMSEFDLQELVQGFECVSIPECESIHKKVILWRLFPGR